MGWLSKVIGVPRAPSVLIIPKIQQQRETNIPEETAKKLTKERLLGSTNSFDCQRIVSGFLKIAMHVPCPITICFHGLL